MTIGEEARLRVRQRPAPGPSRRRRRRSALASALLAATFLAGRAAAQAPQPPPMFRNLDENGIDMGTGLYHAEHVVLSIGEGPAALQLRVKVDGNGVHTNFDGRSTIDMDANGGWFAETWFEDDRNNYVGPGPSWSSEEGDGATLIKSGSSVTWTKSDGTTILFRTDITDWENGAIGYPTEITFPGGHKVKISYKVVPETAVVRVQSVTNSQGYQLKFNYAVSTGNAISSVQSINNAVDYCDPAADTCSGLTQSWPTVQLGRSIPAPTQNQPAVYTVTNTKNDTTTFTYGAFPDPWGWYNHALTSIRRPGSTSDDITFTYNSSGGLMAPATVTRDGVTHSYSAAGSNVSAPRITRTNSAGATLVVISDPMATRSVSIKDETNRTTTFTYDGFMRLRRQTEQEGNYTQYSYDVRGNVTELRRVAKPGGSADIVTKAHYGPGCANVLICNQPEFTTDARNNVTNYSYDPATGLVTAVTAPAVAGVRPETRYTYSPRQAFVKNSSGSVVASGMSVSLLTRISTCQTTSSCATTADEVATTIDYGPQNAGTANNLHIASTTTGSGSGSPTATTSFGYDQLGNRITVDGPATGPVDTTRIRYDSERLRVGLIGPDPDGTDPLKYLAVRTSYNSNGQVTKVERGTVNSQSDPDWAVIAVSDSVDLSYDTNARRVKATLTGGGGVQSAVQYSYDAFGRPECVAQRMNPDLYGSLPAWACSLGTQGSFGPDRISKTLYDQAGRVTETRNGVGTEAEAADATSTYSDNGQVQTVTDAEGNKTTYAYDSHDRLEKAYFPSTAKGSGTSSTGDYEQYGYDPNGNVTTRRLRDGYSLTFTYDAINRMTSKIVPERPNLAPAHTRDVHYGYDLLNRPTYARFDSDTGEGVTNAWNVLGRLVSSTTNMGGQSRPLSYEYDARGNRKRITHPPAIIPTHPHLGLKTFYYDYHYDSLDRPLSITNAGGVVISGWSYDLQGRLEQIVRPGAPPTIYGYDAASRVASIAHDLSGTSVDQTLTYTYNPAGQLHSRSSTNDAFASTAHYNITRSYASNGLNQYLSAGPASFLHDANGNLTSDGSSTFVYDVENRLVSASGAKNAVLLYDPLGRLHQVSGASGWLQFLYDGDALVAEYDGAESRPRVYVHAVGTDVPLVWYEGGAGGRRLYADHQGSIVAVAHWTNAYLAINGYDEYGIPNSGNQGRFQYTGQMWIPELGMYYYKARFYSPTLGRFLQTDPIGYAGGMNLYDYVGGDPVNRVDPTGLQETVVITGDRCKAGPCGGIGVMGLWDIFAPGQPFALVENEKGDGGDERGVQLLRAAAKQRRRHRYEVRQMTLCSPNEAFASIKQRGMSAPGAPAAREGFTPRITLWGNNPISQSVNSVNRTIVNTTLQGHRFFPGRVVIQVLPWGVHMSEIVIVGTGIGENPDYNNFVGELFFGIVADLVEQYCTRHGGVVPWG